MEYPKALGLREILAHPGFPEGLASNADTLLALNRGHPNVVRYLADGRRWMLTQAMLALHFEHARDARRAPVSPGEMLRVLQGTGIASRNTVLSFLQEAQKYDLIQPLGCEDRRRHDFRATAGALALFRLWFDPHLKALDLLDGGGRLALSQQHPEALGLAQPLLAAEMLRCPTWRAPSPAIALFTRAVTGSNILHEIAARARPGQGRDRIWIGPVTSTGIAARQMISQSHVSRLLSRARAAGLIGWERRGNRGDCWVSAGLLREYRDWQAIKFRAISVGFAWAIRGIVRARA